VLAIGDVSIGLQVLGPNRAGMSDLDDGASLRRSHTRNTV